MNDTTHDTRHGVIGLGHVGAPLMVAMASSMSGRLHVEGIDRSRARLEALRDGSLSEVELVGALQDIRSRGGLNLSDELSGLYDVIVVAIEPQGIEPLLELVEVCLEHLVTQGLLIIASTCQPRWFEVVLDACRASGRTPGEDLYLAHAPERMMPGRALSEVVGLPRVIGGFSPACIERASQLYGWFVTGQIRGVGLEEAALIKIAENAYRAINIVLANEIADVAGRYELSPHDIIEAANTHPRVDVHRPGAGAWGRCLPLAMALLGQEGSELAQVAHELNARRPVAIARQMVAALACVPRPVVVVCGLAYKKDQSDARSAAGSEVVRVLREQGCEVRSVDPHVTTSQPISWEMDAALRGAHGVIITVAHSEFLEWTVTQIARRLDEPAVVLDVTGELER